jgi:hypothetical protein
MLNTRCALFRVDLTIPGHHAMTDGSARWEASPPFATAKPCGVRYGTAMASAGRRTVLPATRCCIRVSRSSAGMGRAK